ncbi:MAG: hypothetical protein KKD77_21715 [Gammaproteobacteria bacterium]|nr:hypothetical protein [Gammaproteobacteria bacterium]
MTEPQALTLLALALIPSWLTATMFQSRQAMLGFPASMFWSILGAYAYTLSATPWGDWQFFLFFASLFGMTVFTIYSAYGLREVRAEGTDEDEYIDETEDAEGGSELPPERERRTRAPRTRITRSVVRTKKKAHQDEWGEFS